MIISRGRRVIEAAGAASAGILAFTAFACAAHAVETPPAEKRPAATTKAAAELRETRRRTKHSAEAAKKPKTLAEVAVAPAVVAPVASAPAVAQVQVATETARFVAGPPQALPPVVAADPVVVEAAVPRVAQVAAVKTDLLLRKFGPRSATVGGAIGYKVVVANRGPHRVTGVRVHDRLSRHLADPRWRCVGGKARCATAKGRGHLNTLVSLPARSRITIHLRGRVASMPDKCLLSNHAYLSLPRGVIDADPKTAIRSTVRTCVKRPAPAIAQTSGPRTSQLSFTGSRTASHAAAGVLLTLLGATLLLVARRRRSYPGASHEGGAK